MGEKVLDDCGKLVAIRDLLIDWVLLEGVAAPSEEFSEAIIDVFERLLELRARPKEVTSWNEAWFEAHRLFVYETFLYVVAALLKIQAFQDIRNVYSSHYIKPSTERFGEDRFEIFDRFYAHSETLGSVLAPPGRTFHSPAAELIKRQATRNDLPFSDIIQADLLTLLMALINPDARWYPQLMYYADSAKEFPLFIRAAQHKNFLKLATITGIPEANALREAIASGQERLKVGGWNNFYFGFSNSMNLKNLDTLK